MKLRKAILRMVLSFKNQIQFVCPVSHISFTLLELFLFSRLLISISIWFKCALQAFLHSSNGDIRPGAAADAAISFQRTLSSARPRKGAKPERCDNQVNLLY